MRRLRDGVRVRVRVGGVGGGGDGFLRLRLGNRRSASTFASGLIVASDRARSHARIARVVFLCFSSPTSASAAASHVSSAAAPPSTLASFAVAAASVSVNAISVRSRDRISASAKSTKFSAGLFSFPGVSSATDEGAGSVFVAARTSRAGDASAADLGGRPRPLRAGVSATFSSTSSSISSSLPFASAPASSTSSSSSFTSSRFLELMRLLECLAQKLLYSHGASAFSDRISMQCSPDMNAHMG